MHAPEKTLNAWDSQFWLRIPLPIAELGAQLHAARANYLNELLALIEDAVATAAALALGRLVRKRKLTTSLRTEAAAHLVSPSLGKRVRLLWLLESIEPGITGWMPTEEADDLADLVGLVNPGSLPRKTQIRHVLEAIATLRNDDAHRRLATSRRPDAEQQLERAVFGIIQRNRQFYSPLLWIEEARTRGDGSSEVTARSLNGPTITPYRRGNWQPARQDLLPERVVLGEPGAAEELDPFIVVDEQRVYVLDEIKRSGPVLRCFASRETLPRGRVETWDRVWPQWRSAERGVPVAEATPIPPEAPAPAVPSPVVARPSSIAPGLGAVAALGCGVLVAVVGVAVVATQIVGGSDTGQGTPETSLEEVSPPTRLPERPTFPPVAGRAAAFPELFAGIPERWGATVAEAERSGVPMGSFSFAACKVPFVEMREVPPSARLAVPLHRRTTLAFHRPRGLFEIMVFSDADAESLARVVERELGPPHSWDGPHRLWDYPGPGASAVIRVKVSPISTNRPEMARSAIKIHHLPTTELYGAELRAAHCP